MSYELPAQLALGTVQFGMNYGIQGGVKPAESAAIRLMNYAYSQQIRVFDTANAYGTAEEVIGGFLSEPGISRSDFKIVSKLFPGVFNKESSAQKADVVLQNVTGSLERLKTDYLDGYMFHNAQYIFDASAVEALASVKSKGLVKKIGVSVYTPEQALQALRYPEIEIIQVPYNVMDHRLDQCGFFDAARARGIIVFARSSLLQGLLTMPLERIPTHMQFAIPYLTCFYKICADFSCTALEAAIQYVLARSGINYIVFGVDSQEQLHQYVEVAKKPLQIELLRELEKNFDHVDERLVMPNLWN